jgi:hypothetical protein
MTSRGASERLGTHGKNLWAAIGKVDQVDKELAGELGKEYYACLDAMSDILEGMRKAIEH